jgi:hypothetical protein
MPPDGQPEPLPPTKPAKLPASEHLQALSEQLKSVTIGNGVGLETEIAAARQRKDEANHAILKHESEHGC